MDKTRQDEVMKALVPVGAKISVVIEIKDPDKALDLVKTMYSGDSCQGVLVVEWGFTDNLSILRDKLIDIDSENERHQITMSEIINRERSLIS